MKLLLASRKSKLAQIQTDYIIKLLGERHGVECEKVLMDTKGDMILDVSLDKIGGKGLFTKEIEICLAEGRAHAAVHSMKDVPSELPPGFEIVCMPKREDVRDAFVSANGTSFMDLPMGARIGTSSIRRAAQLKGIRPDIEIVSIRGNVGTRISKIETEKLDGVILAAAGIKRLDIENMITEYFDPAEFVPAVGQGALGVEVYDNSEKSEFFRSLDHEETSLCVKAEREFMRILQGGCHSAMGAYASILGEEMHIVGMFEVSGRLIKKDVLGNKYDYLKLGNLLAQKILGA